MSDSAPITADQDEPPAIEGAPTDADRDEDDRDEGDIAADYIEELLDISDLDGDIDIDVQGDRTQISVTATGSSNLSIISSPETVSALQELTRLAVQRSTGEFSRLILDVGGSRRTRSAELAVLVDEAVAAIASGEPHYDLPAMSSYERKLVHDLAAERGFSSYSEGEGATRHPVIANA